MDINAKIWKTKRWYSIQKSKTKPPYDNKDQQEDLADTGVLVHCSALQHCLHKHNLHGRVIRRKPYPITSRRCVLLMCAKQYIVKSEALCCTDEVKSRITKGVIGGSAFD